MLARQLLLMMLVACKPAMAVYERPDETDPAWEVEFAPMPGAIETTAAGFYVARVWDDAMHVTAYDPQRQPRWSRSYRPGLGMSFSPAITRLGDGALAIGATKTAPDVPPQISLAVISPDGEVRWSAATTRLGALDDIVVSHNGELLVIGTSTDGANGAHRLAILRLSLEGKELGRIDLWPANAPVHPRSTARIVELPDGMIVAGEGSYGTDRMGLEVVRLDAAGKERWHRLYHVADADALVGAFVDADGALRLVGATSGRLAGAEPAEHRRSGEYPYVLAVRVDDGTPLWTKAHDRWKDDAIMLDDAIALPGGDIIVGGAAVNFKRPYRAFIARLAPDGSMRWSRAIPPRPLPPRRAADAVAPSRHVRELVLVDGQTLVVADSDAGSFWALPADGGAPRTTRY